MNKYGFSDLHSFKDFVGFVRLCAPDEFPEREGLPQERQWTLDLAFRALREGLVLAAEEKGDKPVFRECERLVEEAYEQYLAGNRREGFFKLDEAYKHLKKIPTW